MVNQRDEPLQAKLQCYGLVQVSNRVHILARAKFTAHKACVRLTDGAPLPPYSYIQVARTQQLQAEQNYY